MKDFLLFSLLATALLLPSFLHGAERCLTCHEGIEQISNVEEMADLTCIDCHGADRATWVKARGKAGAEDAPDDRRHREAILDILKRAAQ